MPKSEREDKVYNIRQDRVNFSNSGLFFKLGSDNFPILDISRFGVAIECADIDQVRHKENHSAEIFFDQELIQKSRFEIVRFEKTKNGKTKVALTSLDKGIEVESLLSLPTALTSLESLEVLQKEGESIPKEAKVTILELGTKLSFIKEQVESIAKTMNPKSFSDKYSAERTVIAVFGRKINVLLREANNFLSEISAKMTDAELERLLRYYRLNLSKYTLQSSFAHRSYYKPRGYAGDYEMMNQLYRNEDFGKDLFSRCMERAIQLHEEPSAVRGRASFLREKLFAFIENNKDAQSIRILSLACGPAYEIKLLLHDLINLDRSTIEKIELHLLDQDIEALKDAQRKVKSTCLELGLEIDVKYINNSIKDVVAGKVLKQKYNLIYSAGLFDYFDDDLVRTAFDSISRRIEEKGEIIIGNFDKSSPNYFGMLGIFDWRLHLRSEQDLIELFKQSKSVVGIERERSKVNLFAVVKFEGYQV